MSEECCESGRVLPTLASKKIFEKPREAYQPWNSSLPGYVARHESNGKPFESAADLRAAIARVTALRESLRAEMIARQEEMDWLVYEAYGLIEKAPGPELPEAELTLAREERPFVLWAKGEGDFAKAVGLIPAGWSAGKRGLWRKRLELIRDNEHVRRIEQPAYKRRWDEQWKVGNRWQCGPPAYDAEFLDAFYWWLSEKAEWLLEQPLKGGPVALEDWAAQLWQDGRVQAAWTVAAETGARLEGWKASQDKKGKPAKTRRADAATLADAGRAGFVRYFKALVKDQSVPNDIPFAVPWEELEKKRKIPAAVKSIRGKLNVPRERFRVTADGHYRQAGLD